MKLATIRTEAGTTAVRLDGDTAVELDAADVGEVIRRGDGWQSWAAAQPGTSHDLADVTYEQLLIQPGRVLCQGLNYRNHIEEVGMEIPTYPTLFAKYGSSLTGPTDDIVLPPESEQCDWEAELTVVIGNGGRRIAVEDAESHIAGYTIMNDFSMRDWQMRGLQWLQGKSWDDSTPLGPWLVTPDESPGPNRRLTLTIDGETMQDADTADLVFGPAELISYISTFMALQPGDIIAAGTPGGVGLARGRFLKAGEVMVTTIEGLGECRNTMVTG